MKTEDPAPNPEPEPEPEPAGKRALVVYFSCTNTTQGVAEQIAATTGSKTHRIEPKVAYTSADLDYNNSSSRANREQNDPSSRPAIGNTLEGVSDYDVIFLGYPIWWGKAPKIIYTLLESYNLAGKIIVPFCTSGSSGIGSSDTDLHALSSQAVWKPGRRFRGNETEETIINWIESMDLNFNQRIQAHSISRKERTEMPLRCDSAAVTICLLSDWAPTACTTMYLSIA